MRLWQMAVLACCTAWAAGCGGSSAKREAVASLREGPAVGEAPAAPLADPPHTPRDAQGVGRGQDAIDDAPKTPPIETVVRGAPSGPVAKENRSANRVVWVGKRIEVKSYMKEWRLEVTTRDGDAIRGELWFSAEAKGTPYPVVGTLPGQGDGPVALRTEKDEISRVVFDGEIKAGEINLVYNCNDTAETHIVGTGILKPKSAKADAPVAKPRLPGGTRSPAALFTDEQSQMMKSEYYKKAQSLAKKLAKETAARRVELENEASRLGVAELLAALKVNPRSSADDMMRWAIQNERLKNAKEEALTPAERQARKDFALLLLGGLLGAGGSNDPAEAARKNQERRDLENRNGPGR